MLPSVPVIHKLVSDVEDQAITFFRSFENVPTVFANWLGFNMPVRIGLKQRDSQIKNIESAAEPVPNRLLHVHKPK
jgi:hypothetical protein